MMCRQKTEVCPMHLSSWALLLPIMHAVEKGDMLQEKKAVEAAERAEQEAQELKEYRSQLTFKASTFLGNAVWRSRAPVFGGGSMCNICILWTALSIDKEDMSPCRNLDSGTVQLRWRA